MNLDDASVSALVLLAARISGLMLIAPVFSNKTVPTMIKVSLIVAFSILLLPVARASAGIFALPVTPATFIGEMVTGFAIGLGAAIIIGAAEFAGDMMGMQIGLSGAAVFDPISASSQNVLGQFAALFATTMMLAVNGHIVMIDAVAKSLHVMPLATAITQDGIINLVRGGSSLFVLGLQFAAPVVAAVLIGNTALAIMSRAAPQLNILSIAFPVQIGLGLTALAAAIPVVGTFYSGFSGAYAGMLTHLVAPLAH